tara:strand:+ start:938 stop:1096 length:159 start_codon:yes stop_codon:yes gene_type:complete
MNEEIYQDGYQDYHQGLKEHQCAYTGILSEYWSDGWADAEEDDNQKQIKVAI